MKLENPIDNPIPPNPSVGKVETHDGVSLRYAYWKTINPPCKGTVIMLGGRTEYIEKQYETVSFLRKNGFDALAFDWRGQGGSSRMIEDPRRGFVENFDQYITDLDTIISEIALPECRAPFFILAHSTGSLVAALAAPEFGNRIQRMVLGSPMFGLSGLPLAQKALNFISTTMHIIGLGKTYMSGGPTPEVSRAFSGNQLTSDKKRFRRNAQFAEDHRDLTIGGPTASWVSAACRGMDQANEPEFAEQMKIPTLLICAGNDTVVDNKAAYLFGKMALKTATLTIAGAKHELQQERDIYREQLFAAFLSFIPGSIPNPANETSDPAPVKSEKSEPDEQDTEQDTEIEEKQD